VRERERERERKNLKIESSNQSKLHTWLANIYSSKLYAAPAQAVFVTTPVALII